MIHTALVLSARHVGLFKKERADLQHANHNNSIPTPYPCSRTSTLDGGITITAAITNQIMAVRASFENSNE